MKINTNIILVILAFCLIAAGGYIFQLSSHIRSLEDSLNVYEDRMEDEREQRQNTIDSLELVISVMDDSIQFATDEISDKEKTLQELINSNRDEENNIDNIRDSDSLSKLFTRYYPSNGSTSETGN